VKDQNQHIKNIFSDKLGGFEAPVDASVWSSIESSISSSAVATGAATASSGVGSISIGVKIAMAIAAIAAIVTSVVVFNQEDQAPATTETPQVEVKDELKVEENNIEEALVKMPTIDSSSYEEILQPVTDPDSELVAFQIDDPVDVYHSEEIQSSPIARGAPAVVNPAIDSAPAEVQDDQITVPIESEIVQIKLSSEFTVWRDPKNPMRFTFTPLMADAENYQWSIDDLDVSSAKNLNYEFSDEGNYVVRLITSADESSSLPQEADITAYQKPEVIVPNVISPNGDGRNDALDLDFLSINVSIETITIYDASGALIFESSSSSQKWDGKDRFGEACTEGNYVCIYQALGIDQKPYVGREIVRIER